MDEPWVHHYQTEMKEQSNQWKHTSSPIPKKDKVTISAGKVTTFVFWDALGVLMVDYLQKGNTIAKQYYVNLLMELHEKIREKTRNAEKSGHVSPGKCSGIHLSGGNGNNS